MCGPSLPTLYKAQSFIARRQALDHELQEELQKFPEYWAGPRIRFFALLLKQVTRECPQPFHNIVECGTEEVSHVQELRASVG